MKLTVKTFSGLEDALVGELKGLGAKNIVAGRRVVTLDGDERCLYRILYESRLALTVLRPIWKFEATDEHAAYRKVYSCDWTRYIRLDQTFSISPTVHSEIFTHSKYISLKVKDAICDRFRKKAGKRPNIDTVDPDIKLDLYIQNDQFVISLDAAGDPLFKRGYRREGHVAPLNEVLAAGIIHLTEWKGQVPMADGMCGTGTLLLEAAMFKYRIPPQILRTHFACMQWPSFDDALWQEVVTRAQDQIQRSDMDGEIQFYGSDINRSAVFTAHRSARLLDLDRVSQWKGEDFFRLKGIEGALLILNPPYGERIGEDIEEMYKNLGDCFKHKWKGSQVFLFTGNLDALKRVGLRTSKKIPLYNGPIECRLAKYELW